METMDTTTTTRPRSRRHRLGAKLTTGALLAGTAAGALGVLGAAPAHAGPGGIDWFAHQGGTTGDPDRTVAVDTDATGNAYVVGVFSGSFSIAGKTLIAQGWNDVYVAKYSAAGTALWATRLGTPTGTDDAYDIAVDAAGNATIVGSFTASITLAGSTLNAVGSSDGYVAHFDAAGAPTWVRHMSGPFADKSRALDVTADGHIVVAGKFTESLTLAGQTLQAAGGGDDGFVARFDSAGTKEWLEPVGSANAADDVFDVATTDDGEIYLYGKYNSSSQIGFFALPDNGWQSLYLAHLASNGFPTWVRTGGGPNGIGAGRMAVHGDTVAVTGGFNQSLSFDGRQLTSNGNFRDGFVILANTANGATSLARTLGGASSDIATAAAFDDAGNVAVAIKYSGSFTFGGVARSSVGGGDDIVLGLLSPSGAELWSSVASGGGIDEPRGLAATVSGAFVLVGSAEATLTVNGQVYNLPDQQGFAVRFADPLPDTAANRYFPMVPVRALDSRDGTGGFNTKWGPGLTRYVKVAGVAGVPADATAVVLNLTGTGPSAATHLTVWPSNQPMPGNSNLNLAAGQTAANLVTVQTGAAGKVGIFNNAGFVDVIADIAGYYRNDATGSRFTGITPTRVLDSRDGTGGYNTAWGAGQARDVTVAGVNGIPAGATAVVMNVTAVSPSTATHLMIMPKGAPVGTPLSTLNVAAGETRPNLDVAKVANGKVTITNNKGSVHVIVDVVGYFTTSAVSGDFAPIVPARIADTRTGLGGYDSPFGTATRQLKVAGNGGVPASAKAVVLNVTVTGPTAPSHLTVWPNGVAKPTASNLNYVAGQTVPNAVTVKVGTSGMIQLANNSGSTHVIVDVVGWYD